MKVILIFYDFISKIQGDILNTLKYLKMTYLSHLKTAERHGPKILIRLLDKFLTF